MNKDFFCAKIKVFLIRNDVDKDEDLNKFILDIHLSKSSRNTLFVVNFDQREKTVYDLSKQINDIKNNFFIEIESNKKYYKIYPNKRYFIINIIDFCNLYDPERSKYPSSLRLNVSTNMPVTSIDTYRPNEVYGLLKNKVKDTELETTFVDRLFNLVKSYKTKNIKSMNIVPLNNLSIPSILDMEHVYHLVSIGNVTEDNNNNLKQRRQ